MKRGINPINDYDPRTQHEITSFLLKVLEEYPDPPRRFNRISLALVVLRSFRRNKNLLLSSMTWIAVLASLTAIAVFATMERSASIFLLLLVCLPLGLMGTLIALGMDRRIVRALRDGMSVKCRIIDTTVREVLHPLGNFEIKVPVDKIWKTQLKPGDYIDALVDPEKKQYFCDLKTYDLRNEKVVEEMEFERLCTHKENISDAILLLFGGIIFISAILCGRYVIKSPILSYKEYVLAAYAVGWPVLLMVGLSTRFHEKLANRICRKGEDAFLQKQHAKSEQSKTGKKL